jgi:hypothetical protein
MFDVPLSLFTIHYQLLAIIYQLFAAFRFANLRFFRELEVMGRKE